MIHLFSKRKRRLALVLVVALMLPYIKIAMKDKVHDNRTPCNPITQVKAEIINK